MVEANPFDLMAEEYDSWYDSDRGRPVYESELKCLFALVPERHLPVLEIGVGTGRFAMHFQRAFGVDPAFSALKIARNRGVRCVNGAGEYLPFRDEAFRMVLAIATLCFADSPQALFDEACRVLTPGGCAVVGFIPGDSPWGLLYEKKKREGSPFYRNARFSTFDEIEAMAEKAGLHSESVASTLMQDPAGPLRVEEPSNRYVQGAGFVLLRLERKRSP